ncbi:glutamyl endopeptidase [Leptolyngbya sp. NIES-3755]|nr:glutamyl endopeptidase [Leptolyngbya sp. NIES-3755]
MSMKRFASMIVITGAIFAGWETTRMASGVSIEPQRPSFTLKVATSQTTQASVRGEGYIPKTLQKSNQPSEASRNVFGRDQRVPMTSSAYPWSAIGRIIEIDQDGGSMCTGNLIAKDLVVTNAHCVFGENGEPAQKISFEPNFANGASQDRANVVSVVVGTDKPEQNRAKDWAILKLDQPLGEKYGWMEWASEPVSTLTQLPKQFNLAGYSGDFPTKKTGGSTAGVHVGCSIRGFEPALNLATHDCDMTRGASGGAIFTISDTGMAVIVALNDAENTSEGEYPAQFGQSTANYAVLTQAWAGAAQQLRDQEQ